MSEETLDSGQPTLKYMTVPEKIELTPGTSGGEVHEPPNRYRPMRVPDTITLEATAPPAAPSRGVEVEVGEPGVLVTDHHGQGPMGDAGRRLRRTKDPTPVDTQPPAHAHMMEPNVGQAVVVPPANLTDIERRVRTLEQQVQRLTETIVRREGTGIPREGNGFWNVLTFAGWALVPLFLAFMYHYKKTAT